MTAKLQDCFSSIFCCAVWILSCSAGFWRSQNVSCGHSRLEMSGSQLFVLLAMYYIIGGCLVVSHWCCVHASAVFTMLEDEPHSCIIFSAQCVYIGVMVPNISSVEVAMKLAVTGTLVKQCLTVYHSIPQYITVYHSILQYLTVCHSITLSTLCRDA